MAGEAAHTGEHRMHGLDGGWTEADWSAWTLAEADELLREVEGAGRAVALESVSPRPFSAAARVRTTSGTVVVKRHARTVRSVESLREEHGFAQWLAAAGAPVAAPLRMRNGSSAWECVGATGQAWTCEVFPVAPGEDVYAQAVSWTPYGCVEHARASGAALGRLHAASRGYAAASRGKAPLVTSYTLIPAADVAQAVEAYLAARPQLEAWLRRQRGELAVETVVRRWLRPQLERLHGEGLLTAAAAVEPLWTHNDWHGSNLMWSGAQADARVTAVIDFGLADRTCAAQDVATALERSVVDWLGLRGGVEADLEQAAALLAGYEEQVPLTARERRTIAEMLPVVHCEFALSEAEYFLSVLGDAARAQVAWEGYCVGHCAWFATAAGQRLMEWMRRWADGATGRATGRATEAER